jgi:hypothetical protein
MVVSRLALRLKILGEMVGVDNEQDFGLCRLVVFDP